MTLHSLSKTKKFFATAFLVALSMLGFYVAAFQSFDYQSKNFAIGFSLIILAMVTILIIWWNDKESSKLKIASSIRIFIIIALAISMVIVLVFFIEKVKQGYLRNELSQNGVVTTAVIIGFEYERIKSNTIEYATIQYEFENEVLLQRLENFNELSIHQTIPIRISARHPQMFELIEE
jgi:hypothetical protein